VLTNRLTNALRYTLAPGWVRLSASRADTIHHVEEYWRTVAEWLCKRHRR
jgi:hypothetical protein